MNIFIPPELSSIEEDIARFFDAMIMKLRKNAHKGRWQDYTLDHAFELLGKEIEELKVAMDEGNRIEIVLESADIANVSLILCAIALEGQKCLSMK